MVQSLRKLKTFPLQNSSTSQRLLKNLFTTPLKVYFSQVLLARMFLYLTCCNFIMIHSKTKALLKPFYGTVGCLFAKPKADSYTCIPKNMTVTLGLEHFQSM